MNTAWWGISLPLALPSPLHALSALLTSTSPQMAWMAPDVNFFTAAFFSDGLLDICLMDGAVPAAKVPGLLLACSNNTFFDHPLVKYYKVSAFRITPKYEGPGYISIDGEKAPFAPFQAEVHRGLGRVITRRGVMEAPGPEGWEKAL